MTDDESLDEDDDEALPTFGELAAARFAEHMAPIRNLADSVLPRVDLSHLLPRIDIGNLLPSLRIPISDDLHQAMRRMHDQWMSPEIKQLVTGVRRIAEPPNWEGHDVDVRKAVDIIRDDGLPLAWLPPGDVLALVLAAPTRRDRVAVLVAHRSLLLDACHDLLGDVPTESPFRVVADAVGAAVRALADDHPMPAQALAASVVDTLVKNVFGIPHGSTTFGKAYRLRDDTTIGKFRTALVVGAAEPARTTFDWRRDETPPTFNRNATAHTVDPVQFTDDNALIGVLLATTMCREAHELLNRGVLRAN